MRNWWVISAMLAVCSAGAADVVPPVAGAVTLTRDGAGVYVHFFKPGVDTVTFKAEGESHPECRNEKVLSKADAKRILAACRSVGVKVVPLMNLFGHQSQKQGAVKAYVDYAKAHDRGHVVGLLLTTWYASEQLMDALEGEGIRKESEKAFERLRGVVEVYRAFAAKGAK